MKILITGGTGVISSGLVQECVSRGFDTYTINRGTNKYRNVNGATYFYADIWDENSVNQVLQKEKFDVVIECLAYDKRQLEISIKNFKCRCNKYVFISTICVFGVHDNVITEKSKKIKNSWNYQNGKLECELLLEKYKNNGLKYIIIRPAITYGKYRIPFPITTRNPSWTFFQRIIDGKPILSCNNVLAPIVHIKDFSYASVEIIENEECVYEDYNIVFKGKDRWDDVIRYIDNIFNLQTLLIHIPLRTYKRVYPDIYDELKWNKNCDLRFDGCKLSKLIEIVPRIKLEQGLAELIDESRTEYQENNFALDNIWNIRCDMVLYDAYIHGDIQIDEKRALEQYFEEKSINPYVEYEKIKSIDINNLIAIKRIQEIYQKNELSNKRIILYGFGYLGKLFYGLYDYQVDCIIDNKISDERVIRFSEIHTKENFEFMDYVWVVAGGDYTDEIEKEIILKYEEAIVVKLK